MPGLLSAAYGILLPPNRPVRGQSALALLLPLLLAAALLLLVAGPVQAQNVDYDTDNDGLIDIDTAAKLIAIAYDLNGDGAAAAGADATAYALGFPNVLSTQCASTADPSQTCSGYELTADITLTANWTPTGSYTATFDGNGHRINGLTINVSSGNAGLFGDLGATGVIRDVAIISPSITSSSGDDTGALVGESANGSRISASYVSAGTVSSTGTNATVGGLVGYAYGAIRASYSTATVSATGSGAVTGGMVGLLNSDTIIASYAAASVTGAATHTGGLIGRVFSNNSGDSTVTNSYCDTTVRSGNCIGSRNSSATSDGIAAAGHATTALQTPTTYAGLYAFWNIDLDADTIIDFPWNFGTNSQYPTLRTPTQRATSSTTQFVGDYDTDDDTLIEIRNQAQLAAITHDLDGDGLRGTVSASDWMNYTAAYPSQATNQCDDGATGAVETCTGYELGGSLTLTGAWTPIGLYNAVLEGNGYTISNLTYSRSDAGNTGFIYFTGASSVIRNLGFINPSITSTNTGTSRHGVVAGEIRPGSVVSAVYVSGGTVTVSGNTADTAVGGLTGRNQGTIRASWSNATVATAGNPANSNIGGLVGHLDGGTIIASYAYGTVTPGTGASVNNGLLVGRSADRSSTTSTITNSYCAAASGNCVGAQTGGSVAGAAHPAADLQAPTDYTGIYSHWNLDLDADDVPDYLWDFRTSSQYPILNTPMQRAALTPAAGSTDYDADDDGLIDISTQAQLNAVRWDLDGDGDPATADANAYSTVFGGRQHTADGTSHRMGCPLTTPTAGCVGYELTGDLTLTGTWAPVGSFTTPYTATFDGNGRTISGLTISASASSQAGLFSALGSAGVVRNLGLIAPTLTTAGSTSIGAVVGYVLSGGSVQASYVDGGTLTVGGGGVYAGGLVGFLNGGSVSAGWSTIVLNRTSPCNNCNGLRTGGVVGRMDGGSVTASFAAGANNTSGGLTSAIGGLVGRANGVFPDPVPTITDSYCDSSTVVAANCLGERESGVIVADTTAVALATSLLQTPRDYSGIYFRWNLDLDSDLVPDHPWNFGSSSAYPTLNTPTQRAALIAAIPAVDYDYNDNGLIDITNQAQLNAIRWDLNGDGDPAAADGHVYSTVFTGRQHTADGTSGRMGCPLTGCTGYELLTDLTLTSSYDWVPIGDSATARFATTFNGQGYTISGLTMSVSSGPTGLFGQLDAAGVIRNVGILNPSITNAGSSENNGALVSQVQSGGMVDTSYVSGGTITVSGASARAGGLAGQNNGQIRASYSTAAVTHSSNPNELRLGGLVGFSLSGTIIASYAAGEVTGGTGTSLHVGGLLGRSTDANSIITNSYCDSDATMQTACVGAHTAGSTDTATTATDSPQTTSDLQSPTGYTAGSIYEMWNLDLDGDVNTDDNPWDFGGASDYPMLRVPANRPTLAARNALLFPPPPPQPGGGRQPVARGGGSPYNPAHAHPEIYANPRHEMSVSCALKTTGTGEDAVTTSTMTFDLGTYTRPITLVLSLWDGQFFRTLQSQNIAMPQLQQDGQTATVEVVTNPSQTRFRIDSQYGLNLVLGYADCRTDDPEE